MATLVVKISEAPLFQANDVDYTINDLVNPSHLYIMNGSDLGKTPTNIISIDDTGFTLGTLELIEKHNKAIFTPNSTIDESTFEFTIKDSLNRESTATVTITTI